MQLGRLRSVVQGMIRSLPSNPSLQRTVLALRAVPAVPLLGCTSGTALYGFRAAARTGP